jgi:transcriptional repressor NrdR
LRCPYCGTADSVVKDSRPAEEDAAVRRRRGCNNCGGRFTTFERVQLRDLIVVKRDGRKAVFERDKLRRSLKVALQKRPVSEDQLDHMISGIVRQLEMVMESLSTLDPVGFIRYASVYKDFKTPADFAGFIASQSRDDEGDVKE